MEKVESLIQQLDAFYDFYFDSRVGWCDSFSLFENEGSVCFITTWICPFCCFYFGFGQLEDIFSVWNISNSQLYLLLIFLFSWKFISLRQYLRGYSIKIFAIFYLTWKINWCGFADFLQFSPTVFRVKFSSQLSSVCTLSRKINTSNCLFLPKIFNFISWQKVRCIWWVNYFNLISFLVSQSWKNWYSACELVDWAHHERAQSQRLTNLYSSHHLNYI